MKRYNLKYFGLLTIAVLFALVMLPSVSFAAGDVFDTIQAKMISTVKDLRKIAYVIAGFGLVMFSFLAIFNKISFKHLGYIMISLSLLSLMMPFINYFSGANLQDNELNYADFISGGDASIEGSNVTSRNDCSTTNTCPQDQDKDQNQDKTNGSDNNRNIEALPTVDSSSMVAKAEVMNEQMGLAQVVTAQEEKKSLKEKLQNAVDGTKKFVSNVNNAIDAVQDTKEAVTAAVSGAQAVKDVLAGNGNAIDKLVGVSQAISVANRDVSGNLAGALDESASVASYLGANDESNLMKEDAQGIRDSASNVEEWTDIGKDVGRVSDEINYTTGRITGR